MGGVALGESDSKQRVDEKIQTSNNPVFVTKCLSQECVGSYTDTISESFLILCRDPKHGNQKQDAGQVTNLGPATENRARTDNEGGTCEGDILQND